MKRRLYHPLWVHLPAFVYTLATVYAMYRVWPRLGDRIPLQFGLDGHPERFGSPWELLGIPAIMLFYLLTSVVIDELWARQETRKTFNWLSLFDDVIIGFMAGMGWGYLAAITVPSPIRFTMPWDNVLLATISALIGAVVLEHVRPWHPYQSLDDRVDAGAVREDIQRQLRAQQRWVHWEVQNPAWMNAILLIASVLMMVGAAGSYKMEPLSAAFLVVCGVAIVLLLTGGMRTRVTPGEVDIRIGLIGLRVFHLSLTRVADITVRTFAPLREFGGYGIRWNGKTTAYFFRGNRGVQLTTDTGKQFLIGSDHAERLAAVIDVARESAQ